jgi:uncharacterized protein YbaP (TraB family)
LFAFFLPAFFIATSLGLQAKTAAVEQTTKNCLWTVDTPSNKIYLLGSVHLLKPDDYPLSESINKAYKESQLIVFETDLTAMMKPEMLMKFQELSTYPQGEDLLQNLDLRTKRLLEKKLSELGLPLESYTRFKPWAVAQNLAMKELQRLGFNLVYGVDFHFFKKATQDGKETDFLESPEFQLDLIGNMVTRDQNEFLNQALEEMDVIKELSGDLVKSWKTGNVDKLYKLLHKSFEDYPDIHDRFLIQRNKKWINKVEDAMLKNKNVLFVVGAGHLVGPESVVDLLKKKGYQVTQQ